MKKVRVLAATTPDGSTTRYSDKDEHQENMVSMFATGIYDLGSKMNFHVNGSDLLNYKVFGELENIQMVKVYDNIHHNTKGIYLKLGRFIKLEYYTVPQIQNIKLSEYYGNMKKTWSDLKFVASARFLTYLQNLKLEQEENN
jgi:hypothetical protein